MSALDLARSSLDALDVIGQLTKNATVKTALEVVQAVGAIYNAVTGSMVGTHTQADIDKLLKDVVEHFTAKNIAFSQKLKDKFGVK